MCILLLHVFKLLSIISWNKLSLIWTFVCEAKRSIQPLLLSCVFVQMAPAATAAEGMLIDDEVDWGKEKGGGRTTGRRGKRTLAGLIRISLSGLQPTIWGAFNFFNWPAHYLQCLCLFLNSTPNCGPRGSKKHGFRVNFSFARPWILFQELDPLLKGEMAAAVNLELDANVQTFETQFLFHFI